MPCGNNQNYPQCGTIRQGNYPGHFKKLISQEKEVGAGDYLFLKKQSIPNTFKFLLYSNQIHINLFKPFKRAVGIKLC